MQKNFCKLFQFMLATVTCFNPTANIRNIHYYFKRRKNTFFLAFLDNGLDIRIWLNNNEHGKTPVCKNYVFLLNFFV